MYKILAKKVPRFHLNARKEVFKITRNKKGSQRGHQASQETDENKDEDPEKGIGMDRDREKFGQLILRRVIKIVATKCQILRLKCTKFDFGCGSAPDPAGECTALPRPSSWI